MIKVYADLVEKGQKTLDQVPVRIRPQVIEELIRRGYIIDGSEVQQRENRRTTG